MSPFDTIFGTIMVGLCGICFLAIAGLLIDAWLTDRRNTRRAAAMANHPSTYEASAYGPAHRTYRTDLCMVTNCDGTRAHDLGNGWLVCTDCRDEIVAGWGREQLPFDREVADLDVIEDCANGGAA